MFGMWILHLVNPELVQGEVFFLFCFLDAFIHPQQQWEIITCPLL